MELTDKQKWILELLYEGGYRWIATDKDGFTNSYKTYPYKVDSWWDDASCNGVSLDKCFNPNLTSWEDEEPLDIGKALGIIDWSKVPIDTKVLVKDKRGNEWHRRYFARYTNGKVYAWADGQTSWSHKVENVIEWDEAKLADEEM